MKKNQPSVCKLAYSVEEVAQATTLSPISVRRLIALGTLRAVRVGRRVLVLAQDVQQLLQPNEPQMSVQEAKDFLQSLTQ